MTRRSDKAWLNDIHECISKIENHPCFPKGRAGYDSDEYYQGWVYLQLERICEAMTHLCNEFHYDDKYPTLPWQEIIGMRIILAHHYWKIEDEIIWNVVENHLPSLKASVKNWLHL